MENGYSHRQETTRHCQVLILGAGAAGLSAAKTLWENGVNDFVIVEGSNRFGGRIRSIQIGGKTVEAGANWIAQRDGNPFWDIATKFEVRGKDSDTDNITVRNSKGENVTESEADSAENRLNSALQMCTYQQQKIHKGQVPDMSLKACLEINGWRAVTPVEKAIEFFAFDFNEGGSPGVVSCLVQYVHHDINDLFCVNDSRGFEFILEKFIEGTVSAEDGRVYFNNVVTKIASDDSSVTVLTKNGNMFTADYAIVTFSIGVMKSGDVTFEPPLPDWKVESLYRIHMENYTNIYLRFQEDIKQFWDDTEFVLYASERRGYYPTWQNLQADGFLQEDSNILRVIAHAEDGDRVVAMSDDDITSEVMEVLRKMYPNVDIPEPEEIIVTRWRTDPLHYGSFCSVETGGMSKENLKAARAPVGRVHFAGEAYHEKYFSFATGAIKSGNYTARTILEAIECIG